MSNVITRTLSPFHASWPGVEGATRNVTSEIRSNERPGKRQRVRYIMAWRGLPCALCGLYGSWLAPVNAPWRMTFGHVIGLSLFGASNIANYTPQHNACNSAAKRTPDLRGMVDYVVSELPSQIDADDWAADGGIEFHEPESLPTETAMRMARKGRGLPF